MRQIIKTSGLFWPFVLGFAATVSPGYAQVSTTSVTITPQLVQQAESYSDLTLSPDGRLLATLHRGSIYVWNVASGTILRVISPPGVPKFAFTNDNGHLRYVTVSIVGGKPTLLSGDWNLSTGDFTQHVGPSGIFVATVVPGGKRAILGGNPTGTVHVFDIENNKILNSFGTPPPTGIPANQLDPRTISILAASENGHVAILTRVNGQVEIWDTERQSLRYKLKESHLASWLGVSPDGTRAAYTRPSLADNRTPIDVVDVASGKLVRTIFQPGDTRGGAAFSKDGKTMLAITSKGTFQQWNVDSGAPVHQGELPSGVIQGATVFVEGNQCLWGSANTLVRWDLAKNKLVQSLLDEKYSVFAITSAGADTSTGRAAALGTDDKTSRVISWDLSTLGLKANVPTAAGGKIAANASRVWIPNTTGFTLLDLNTFQSRPMVRDAGTALDAAFMISGNGQKMVVPGNRRGSDPITNRTWFEIVLSEWNASSGSKIDKVVRKRSDLSQAMLAMSHEGRFVVTNEYDMTSKHRHVRLWDLDRDVLMLEFDMTKTTHIGAALSNNGQTLGLAFMDQANPGRHTVQIIDVPTGKVRTTATSSIVGLVQAMAFSPNADKLALGCVTVEVLHTATGNVAHTFRGDPQWVTSLGFSGNGNYLYAAGRGGTTNLYRLDKPASVTMISSGTEWLVYDEDGYFDASRQGGGLVAAVDGLRAYRIDQLAVRYNRPDLLLERMGLGRAETVAHYRWRYHRRMEKLGIATEATLPTFRTTPDVTISRVNVEGGWATVQFDAVARGVDLFRYNVFVNDVPMFGALGKTTSGQTQHIEERIEVGTGRNKIEVSAMDARGGESLRAVQVVERHEKVKGNLYYLAFGVSKYKNPRYNLGFPQKDVVDLGDVFRAGAGKTFGEVYVRTYVNEMATVENIRKAKAFLQDATVEDTVVLFIAGHGLHTQDTAADYYFATHEVDPKNLTETAARFELIEDLLSGIRPRKKLFLMDTCESGEREKDDAPSAGIPTDARSLRARSTRQLELDMTPTNASSATMDTKAKDYDRERYIYNDLSRRTGAVVISSSRGAESSYEFDDIANGAFTEELLIALTSKKADQNADQWLSTDELRAHLMAAVPQRTQDLQHPTVDRDNLEVRFGFPLVTEAADIANRQAVPVQEMSLAETTTAPNEKPPIATRPRACGCDVAPDGNGYASGVVAAMLWLTRRRGRKRSEPR